MAVRIILTDEQMKVVRQSKTAVDICDPHGLVVGSVDPTITPEFVAEMKRRAASPGPWYTGEEVRQHLQGLEQAWQREGPFDRDRMMEILNELRSKRQ